MKPNRLPGILSLMVLSAFALGLLSSQAAFARAASSEIGLNTVQMITAANASGAALSGTCWPPDAKITLEVADDQGTDSMKVSPLTACSLTGTWTSRVDLSRWVDGVNVLLMLTIEKSNGGATMAQIRKDTLAPLVKLDASVSESTIVTQAFAVSGTCSVAGSPVRVKLGYNAATPPAINPKWDVLGEIPCGADHRWAGTVSLGGIDKAVLHNGSYALGVTHTDAAHTGAYTATVDIQLPREPAVAKR